MKATRLAASMFGSLILTAVVAAQTPAPPAVTPAADSAAKTILEEAGKTLKGLDALTFAAELTPSGAAAKGIPPITGTVTQARAKAGLKYHVKGNLKDKKGQSQEFLIVSDGEKVANLNPARKQMMVAELPDGEGLAGPGGILVMHRMAAPDPFEHEIDEKLTMEAAEAVNGVDCHVIRVDYEDERAGTARFFVGKADHILRRVDRVRGKGNEEGRITLVMGDMKPNPQIDGGLFSTRLPDGYKLRDPGALLENGEEAPDFTLKTPEGKEVNFKKDLAGKVVMIDFWGTWCMPCKAAMPSIQKVHEHFKDNKNVAIYGISLGERPGSDPAGYMKKQKFTYGLLLEGEEAAQAYNVGPVPCFYVVGKDGKVVHSEIGLSDDLEKSMIEIIEKALK